MSYLNLLNIHKYCAIIINSLNIYMALGKMKFLSRPSFSGKIMWSVFAFFSRNKEPILLIRILFNHIHTYQSYQTWYLYSCVITAGPAAGWSGRHLPFFGRLRSESCPHRFSDLRPSTDSILGKCSCDEFYIFYAVSLHHRRDFHVTFDVTFFFFSFIRFIAFSISTTQFWFLTNA